MSRVPALLAGACLSVLLPRAGAAQDRPAEPQPSIVQRVTIEGPHELSQDAVREAIRVRIGEPLPVPVDDIARRVEGAYRDEGFTFATVKATFAEDSGSLAIVVVEEGKIDGVEFLGIDEHLAKEFAADFALRAGDVFNRTRARQALDVLLRPTRGAVRPGRIHEHDAADADAVRQRLNRRSTFDLVDRGSQRILLVGLSEPAGRFKLVPDFGDREDWFTPVDGFVPSLGFGAAVFDHEQFNHAYVAGHLSFKMAAQRAGYAFGFERPWFETRKLYVGGELYDLTASDDQWQVSSLEASLAAVGPRHSFRDYYRRRGLQVGSAFRVHPQIELLFAWRGERQESLAIASDFSFWNSDDPFRPNRPIQNGRSSALMIGASIDGRGFDRESLDATYRRHQLGTAFGERLDKLESADSRTSDWRIDWTSEISPGSSFDSDFDFRRHVVSARYRLPLSPHEEFGMRAIGGWSDGVLPPQRQFGVGGIGSVHGYDFKTEIGDSLALLNLEYGLGWTGFKVLGFFDAGRAALRPVAGLPTPDAPWLKGVGFGVAAGDFRVDFGYRLNDVPSSLQVTLRFGRTF